MIRITKEFKFEMAHALHAYDGLCKNIHGHSYRLWVTVKGEVRNEIGHTKDGMVMEILSCLFLTKYIICHTSQHQKI
jgi:6-pyruvoyltetrahydropterin/6-carboxytetrahydropterin synthase